MVITEKAIFPHFSVNGGKMANFLVDIRDLRLDHYLLVSFP